MAKSMSLTEQLQSRADASAKKSPAERKQIMMGSIDNLRKSEIMKTALKKGDVVPEFSLKDIKKGLVSSKKLLNKGPLIITFYRGGWCPYCNLQLRDLQMKLKEIKKTGANLVAISPELPDSTAKTVKKGKLDFYVLSDNQGVVAKKFGLVYKLDKKLIAVYKKFGIDLVKENGNNKWELPISATYIVNKKGKIIYSFVEADYKKRAETTELISILKKL